MINSRDVMQYIIIPINAGWRTHPHHRLTPKNRTSSTVADGALCCWYLYIVI